MSHEMEHITLENLVRQAVSSELARLMSETTPVATKLNKSCPQCGSGLGGQSESSTNDPMADMRRDIKFISERLSAIMTKETAEADRITTANEDKPMVATSETLHRVLTSCSSAGSSGSGHELGGAGQYQANQLNASDGVEESPHFDEYDQSW